MFAKIISYLFQNGKRETPSENGTLRMEERKESLENEVVPKENREKKVLPKNVVQENLPEQGRRYKSGQTTARADPEEEEIHVYNAHKGERLLQNENRPSENRNDAKIITGQIYKRDERIVFVKPNSIRVDLNTVCSEFIPKVGDLVELEIKPNTGETDSGQLEIIKISPVRKKVVKSVVHSFDEQTFTGCIDEDIFFDRESLTEGYLPRTLDRVITEVIESNQDGCKWRALTIILQKSFQQHVNLEKLEDHKYTDYELNVGGVRITDNIVIHSSKFNENCSFYVTVTNELSKAIVLREITFESKIPQVKLIYPKVHNCMLVNSCALVKFEFVVNAKTIGRSTEIIIFVFNEFSIGRTVTINMNIGTSGTNHVVTYKHHINHLTRARHFLRNELELNREENTDAINKPRIDKFMVPESLWDIFLKYDNRVINIKNINFEVSKEFPCLTENVTFQCYEDRFHTLLYMEEIDSVIAMRKYDQDKVRFERNGEFMMLEVENLAEKRPSIIIGAKIIAIHPMPNVPNVHGYIHKVTTKHLLVKFETMLQESEYYSVRAVQSRVAIKKLHYGVHFAVKNLGSDFLFPSRVTKKDVQVSFTFDEYSDTFDSGKKAAPMMLKNNKAILKAIRSNIRTSPPKSSVRLEWYDNNLNYFQKEAVRNVLLGEARPLPYIIFGPPGTGKTVTLVEIILQILKMIPRSRILVGAPSNNAADLIALRLVGSNKLKIGELIRFVSYKSMVDNNVPTKLIPYGALGTTSRDATSDDDPMVVSKGLGCNLSPVGNHRVVIGTCSAIGSLNSMGFCNGHFSHIIIDEAGQCTEPEIMIPLALLNVKQGQCILSGDPMQLGPVINSKHATEFGLSDSFIERLLNRFPYVRDIQGFPQSDGYDPRLVTCLVYNYRSLPGVISLSNKLFYHSELRPTLSETNSTEANFLKTLNKLLPTNKAGNTPSLVFHGLNGRNFQSEDSPSWYNPDEASQVFYYVNELYKLGVSHKDIGIISPYTKQVHRIRRMLKDAAFKVPKIGTVEEFQGHEFNVIILSTVRSSTDYLKKFITPNLGFISNPKRMNVSLTRAHCLTIVVGNPFLLKYDPYWRTLLIDCITSGAYVGCELQAGVWG